MMPMWRFTRIALPCQPMLRVLMREQAVGVLAGFVEHALVADAEVHRLIDAVTVDQLVRNRRAAPAEAPIRLLKRDDVGVDLMEHVEHPLRIAPPVEPNRLAHIVRRDGDAGGRAHGDANNGAAGPVPRRRDWRR